MNSKLLGFVLGSCLVIAGILYFSASKPKDDVLKVGVTAGPHAMIMAKIKEVAAKANFKINIVEFNDFAIRFANYDYLFRTNTSISKHNSNMFSY